MVDNDLPCVLGNAIAMAPYIKGWSEIDIESRSWVLTVEQQMLNTLDATRIDSNLSYLQKQWVKKFWKEEVDQAVQAWQQSK